MIKSKIHKHYILFHVRFRLCSWKLIYLMQHLQLTSGLVYDAKCYDACKSCMNGRYQEATIKQISTIIFLYQRWLPLKQHLFHNILLSSRPVLYSWLYIIFSTIFCIPQMQAQFLWSAVLQQETPPSLYFLQVLEFLASSHKHLTC